MQLLGRLEIRSRERIERFLSEERVGRIASVDADGYPQVIPMNFAFVGGRVYMHSHVRGEKLDNVRRDPRVGFEVDRELAFLPSYFSDPRDASQADTLYVSVVIKGSCRIVGDAGEKARALNALMEKYQPEGGYDPVRPGDASVGHVAVLRVDPAEIRGKYKVGQHLPEAERAELAGRLAERGPAAARALEAMGFAVRGGRAVRTGGCEW